MGPTWLPNGGSPQVFVCICTSAHICICAFYNIHICQLGPNLALTWLQMGGARGVISRPLGPLGAKMGLLGAQMAPKMGSKGIPKLIQKWVQKWIHFCAPLGPILRSILGSKTVSSG